MTVYKTVDIRVYDTEAKESIIVSEDGDGLGMVNVRCLGDYFGKVDFSLDEDVAVMLANAILEQVKYIKENHE